MLQESVALPSAALADSGSTAARLALQNWIGVLPRRPSYWSGPKQSLTCKMGASAPATASTATTAVNEAAIEDDHAHGINPYSDDISGVADSNSIGELHLPCNVS